MRLFSGGQDFYLFLLVDIPLFIIFNLLSSFISAATEIN
jgi:hypothetical protein